MSLVSSTEASFSGRFVIVGVEQTRLRTRHVIPGFITGQRQHSFGSVHSSPMTASRNRIRCQSSSLRNNNGNNNNGVHTSMTTDTESELVWTKFVAETLLPTKQGKFRLRGYRHTIDNGITYTEPSAIISGVVEGQTDVVVRVHDACFTSEVLGSLKCDCREQLELAMDYIQDAPPGMIIYLQQEGRGIGLANKIAAYALQEKGLDTVDANRALGLPDDCREYTAVRHILDEMGIKSIRLMTNNPRKISEMQALGINVTDRVPCIVKAQAFNEGYLKSKQQRMKHMLKPDAISSNINPIESLELDGSFCFWNHEGEPSSAGIPLEPAIKPSEAGDLWLASGVLARPGTPEQQRKQQRMLDRERERSGSGSSGSDSGSEGDMSS